MTTAYREFEDTASGYGMYLIYIYIYIYIYSGTDYIYSDTDLLWYVHVCAHASIYITSKDCRPPCMSPHAECPPPYGTISGGRLCSSVQCPHGL